MSTYRFLPNLYTSEQLREVTKKKWMISHGLLVKHCYAIVLAQREDCALEIMTIKELHQKFRRKDHYDIIGLSTSRHGAIRLLTEIYQDVYLHTNSYAVKEYMKTRME
ncbi:MAG: hypothetical protein K6G04_04315 [Lachnospiraceae bacterium]|nr:hypothetical protein [Lachnospiraceae bacterium]